MEGGRERDIEGLGEGGREIGGLGGRREGEREIGKEIGNLEVGRER